MHRHGGGARAALRLALTLAIASVFFARGAAAQEPTFGIGEDAPVVAPRTLRLGIRADFLYADVLRQANGDRVALASQLGFAPGGNVSLDAAVSLTRLPITIEYGVLPRLSIGVTVPVVRRRVETAADTSVRRAGTSTAPPRLTDITALGSLSHTNVGDLEFAVRLGVLDSWNRRAPLRLRLSAEGAFRLAAGPSRNANVFLDPGAGDGQNDIEVRVLGDLGIGPRVTLSGRVARAWQRPDRQSVVYADSVFPSRQFASGVSRDLGDLTMIDVSPRYRFTRYLSLAATASLRAKGADVYAGKSPAPGWGLVGEPVGSYSALRVGGGIVFSTAPSGGAIGPWPLELEFQHARIVHASGAPITDWRLDQLGGRIYVKLF